MTSDDDPVGYGRPPKAHRFKKGASGNPKGRPRHVHVGPAEHTTLSKVISRKINISVDGRTRRVSIKEAVALQLVDKAAKGDFKSMREVMAVATISEGSRELPAEFDGEFNVLLDRLLSLSVLEEGLIQAGLLYSDADQKPYFKRDVFEAATAAKKPRRSWPQVRLTTAPIEAAGAQANRESMFEVFSRAMEQLLQCRR